MRALLHRYLPYLEPKFCNQSNIPLQNFRSRLGIIIFRIEDKLYAAQSYSTPPLPLPISRVFENRIVRGGYSLHTVITLIDLPFFFAVRHQLSVPFSFCSHIYISFPPLLRYIYCITGFSINHLLGRSSKNKSFSLPPILTEYLITTLPPT